MRRLALHASALSDAEYDFFTKSLREIADDDLEHPKGTPTSDDASYEDISIGVREARAWFRGRYSRVSLSTIDGILKLFAPNVGREDVINGTEFFAALRLVTHAENGKEIDRSLAFVQVNPPVRSTSSIRAVNESRSPSPARVAEFLQDPYLPNESSTSSVTVAESTINSNSTASIMATDSGTNNQFPTSYPPQSPKTQTPDLVQHSAFNPFIHPNLSDRSNDGKLPPLPPRKPFSSTSTSNKSHAPPPPPRHVVTPRMDRSISPSKKFSDTTLTIPLPPKPSLHVTSTLIKQSLQARKMAQSMKKAEEQLDKEKVLQVLKSSSIVTGTNIHNQHQHQHPNPGSEGAKSTIGSVSSGSEGGRRQPLPPLPKRRSGHPASQQPSPPLSDCSLEQVALASSLPHPETSQVANSQDNSRSSNRDEFPNHPLPAPPPMHPDRNPSFGYHQLNPSPKPPSDSPQLKRQNLETFESTYGSMTSQSISPFRSTSGGSIAANPPTPLTSPLNSITTQTRSFRSQSLSHHSPVSQAPFPLPVRRRPDSTQLFEDSSRSLSRHTSLRSRGIGHRKSSLSLSSTSSPFTDDNTLPRMTSGASTSSVGGTTSSIVGSNIQRTIEVLHSIHGQLQPKLEKARYKAEAGLSRRGYVRNVVRSSGEESPTAVESEEQEGLTREFDSHKAKRTSRWVETPVGESLQLQTKVDDGIEGGSDDSEWERGRAASPVRLDKGSNHYPERALYDSPERVGDRFDGGHDLHDKKSTLSEDSEGWR